MGRRESVVALDLEGSQDPQVSPDREVTGAPQVSRVWMAEKGLWERTAPQG